jgi:hypothetical protein
MPIRGFVSKVHVKMAPVHQTLYLKTSNFYGHEQGLCGGMKFSECQWEELMVARLLDLHTGLGDVFL